MSSFPTYQNLAPSNLRVYRDVRYEGGGFELALDAFAERDRDTIRLIYERTKHLYDSWLYMQGIPHFPTLLPVLQRMADPDFFTAVSQLGVHSAESHGSPPIRKALHDIRGGGMTALTGFAQLWEHTDTISQDEENMFKQVVFIARDHAKLMRNILPDLDPVIRSADESRRLHLIEGFVEKWDGFVYRQKERKVQVSVYTDMKGYITSRCLETSSLDRILLNFMNNAARFSADQQIKLTIYESQPGILRWVIENAITPQHKAWLLEHVGTELDSLFHGGYTRGGNGIGLSSCADIVGASFGVSSDQAIQDKMLGASLSEKSYIAWFHWPSYIPEQTDTECDCESPNGK
jgi:signal transduction histidine kinase